LKRTKPITIVRFANAATRQGHQVKLFLMSARVEVENITHEKYNAKKQLDEFTANSGVGQIRNVLRRLPGPS
jgi:sulfur relay (sulfurtransferase) complex TusBCD TusD component (DsrE family)